MPATRLEPQTLRVQNTHSGTELQKQLKVIVSYFDIYSEFEMIDDIIRFAYGKMDLPQQKDITFQIPGKKN